MAHIKEKGSAITTNDWSTEMDGQLANQCKVMDNRRRNECTIDKKTTHIIQLTFGFTSSVTSTVHAPLTLTSGINIMMHLPLSLPLLAVSLFAAMDAVTLGYQPEALNFDNFGGLF